MNANDLFNIIKGRRTVPPIHYSNEEITQEELNLILESANWAPTHKKTEPWRFKVIQGSAKKRFSEFMLTQYKNNTKPELQNERKINDIVDKCLLSDKIILICMKESKLLPEWEELAATASAVQNMWLMCTAMKIGSYWSSPSMIHKMNEFIDLDENETCYGIFYMGKLNKDLWSGNRAPFEDKVTYINE